MYYIYITPFFTGTIAFAFILFLHSMTLKKMKKEMTTIKQSSIKIHIDTAGAFTNPTDPALSERVLVDPLLL
jgi:hypothetical protein